MQIRTNAKDQALAVCAGRKSIYIFESSADVSPGELKIADKYGAITCFQTFDDKIVVGFGGTGHAAVYAIQQNQLKGELFSIKMFESISNVVYNAERSSWQSLIYLINSTVPVEMRDSSSV